MKKRDSTEKQRYGAKNVGEKKWGWEWAGKGGGKADKSFRERKKL